MENIKSGGQIFVPFTASQLMALQDLLLDYVLRPGRLEFFVDVARGVETTPEQLLAVLVGSDRVLPRESPVPDLVACIGPDVDGRIGLRVVATPAGPVPLVAVMADRERVQLMAAALQVHADRSAATIRLARFGFVEDLAVLEPINPAPHESARRV
jgi:hypothetical protein